MPPILETGDLVLLKPTYGGDVMLLVNVDRTRPKNCYTGQKLDRNRTRFRLSPDQIERRIARLDDPKDPILLGKTANVPGYVVGTTDPNRAKWDHLRTLKMGDIITVRRASGPEKAVFGTYLPRGQRFVFTAKPMRGPMKKFPIEALVVPDAVPATAAASEAGVPATV